MPTYKAKRVSNDQWIEGTYSYNSQQDKAYITTGGQPIEIHRGTVREKTSWLDKLNNAISEGDIIKHNNAPTVYDLLEYDEENNNFRSTNWTNSQIQNNLNKIEIMGNKFDDATLYDLI